MTDLEVGRYALRSFRFAKTVSPTLLNELPWMNSDQAMSMSYGEWARHHQRSEADARFVWQSPSFAHRDDWVDGTCAAVCRRNAASTEPKHAAPDENCHCGIYGSLSYADLLGSFANEARRMVVVIAAEGTTIIGTRGLRTQFARVVGFWVDESRAWDEGHPTRTAQEQFKDAAQFADPLSLVERFEIALLPPPGGVPAQRLPPRAETFWSGRAE